MAQFIRSILVLAVCIAFLAVSLPLLPYLLIGGVILYVVTLVISIVIASLKD